MKRFQKLTVLLLVMIFCLSLAACGGSKTSVEEFYGAWKYDDHDLVFVIYDDTTWGMYDTQGCYVGDSECVFDAETGVMELLNGPGGLSLNLSFTDGQLADTDGNTVSPYDLDVSQGFVLPAAHDPLTESISLQGFPVALEVLYPATMEGHLQDGFDNRLSFNPVNAQVKGESDDYYCNISFTLIKIGDKYDSKLGHGYDAAEIGMRQMLDDILPKFYAEGQILESIGTGFKDGGTYYDMTRYLWVDGGIFVDPTDQPVRAALTIRYAGPTGYLLVAATTSVERRVKNYFQLMQNMLAACTFGGDWSTSPKGAAKGDGQGGALSDTGDYGDTYYWYDADGDVWYWNGSEDVFIGFGTDYYIDDDGQYYENNDAGWDDGGDYYEPNDYYEDDYDPWSDPGDGDDYWSDPGDTDYYEDDGEYYESNDAGW